jgi:hypothetical protein
MPDHAQTFAQPSRTFARLPEPCPMIPTPGLTNMTHTALFKKNSDVLSRNSYIQHRSRIPFPKLELLTLACHRPAVVIT